MIYTIFDVESNGLLDIEDGIPAATKIHCLSAVTIDTETKEKRYRTLTDYREIAAFIESEDCQIIIGHNAIRFDKPMIQKFVGVPVSGRIYDTMAFSWYLYPYRGSHKLEDWGTDLGIKKPEIIDWSPSNLEQIIERCEEDVKITEALFEKELDYLKRIYVGQNLFGIMDYISFKMDCAAEQEQVRWKFNVEQAKANLQFLNEEEERKMTAVSEVMPKVTIYKEVNKPACMTKKDGETSKAGYRWLDALAELGLEDCDELASVKLPSGEKPGNPGSYQQLKAWLFSLGWIPDVYKYVKEEHEDGTVTNRPIPQISLIDGTDLSQSVKDLIELNPELEHVNGLFTIRSRKTPLNGMIETGSEDGYVKAGIKGLTNTLRFQHVAPLVNLPSSYKRYGEYVRSVLIAPEEMILCGSDMSSLEDNTKRHYMWKYDPEYVTAMMEPGFDPHLDIAQQGGLLTAEQVTLHKLYEATEGREGQKFTKERKDGKQTNFACTYGAGAPKVALTSGMPLSRAQILVNAFRKRNWSIEQIAKDTYYKTVDGQMWAFNIVSQFWYAVRAKKDIWSTINQSTGAFCFDTQVMNVRKRGIRICGQFHDEWISAIPEGTEEQVRAICMEAIRETNEQLKLNVQLGISVQFGLTYADIH